MAKKCALHSVPRCGGTTRHPCRAQKWPVPYNAGRRKIYKCVGMAIRRRGGDFWQRRLPNYPLAATQATCPKDAPFNLTQPPFQAWGQEALAPSVALQHTALRTVQKNEPVVTEAHDVDFSTGVPLRIQSRT